MTAEIRSTRARLRHIFGRDSAPLWPWELTALLIGSILLLLGLSFIFSRSLLALKEGNDWVDHSERVRYQVSRVLQLLTDIETAERGFVDVSDERFLEPFQTATPQLPVAIATLEQLTANSPVLEAKATVLDSRARDCLAHAQQVIDEVRRGNVANARALLDDGKRRMDAAREVAAQMQAEEVRLLEERRARSATARHWKPCFPTRRSRSIRHCSTVSARPPKQ